MALGLRPFWSAGIALLVGYATWARIRPRPAVDLRILSSRDPTLALMLSVIASLVLFAVLFLI